MISGASCRKHWLNTRKPIAVECLRPLAKRPFQGSNRSHPRSQSSEVNEGFCSEPEDYRDRFGTVSRSSVRIHRRVRAQCGFPEPAASSEVCRLRVLLLVSRAGRSAALLSRSNVRIRKRVRSQCGFTEPCLLYTSDAADERSSVD